MGSPYRLIERGVTWQEMPVEDSFFCGAIRLPSLAARIKRAAATRRSPPPEVNIA